MRMRVALALSSQTRALETYRFPGYVSLFPQNRSHGIQNYYETHQSGGPRPVIHGKKVS